MGCNDQLFVVCIRKDFTSAADIQGDVLNKTDCGVKSNLQNRLQDVTPEKFTAQAHPGCLGLILLQQKRSTRSKHTAGPAMAFACHRHASAAGIIQRSMTMPLSRYESRPLKPHQNKQAASIQTIEELECGTILSALAAASMAEGQVRYAADRRRTVPGKRIFRRDKI